MVVTLGQQYNIGEKPTVILYTYINRRAGTPEKQRRQNSTSSIIFISDLLIRYESSRGYKIDGTKPNQTGNTFGDKQGKYTEENGQESSQQRASSPCRKGHRRDNIGCRQLVS